MEVTDEKDTHIENEEDTNKRWTRSKVWGTDPTRRSECISNRVLITKASEDDAPVAKLPKMYKDAVESPEGQHWKEAMDYELTKLEEMNTWTEIDESDLPPGAQVLLGMWVHLIKNLETGECKFRSHWVV